jgi:RNA polymerase sigma-70 factor (ECF subfamily)
MSNSPAEHLPLASDTTTLLPTTVCEHSENSLRLLVSKAQRGNEQAWDALFRRSYPKLLAYASRRLPTSELAKDAVGETMTRAVAGIDRLRFERGGFDAWMYGIARHVVLDAQRTLWREGPGRVPDAADLDSGPSERAIATEESAQIRRAFERLGRSDQEILELRVVAGLSSDEVAVVLGRLPGAIRMAQKRALSRLRSDLLAQRSRGISD